MEDKLLEHAEKLGVRVYNVGLGDCIYVRVPDQGTHVHILIDCGNKFGEMKVLEGAIKNVKANLPREDPNDPNSKRVLDLLVVTHPHEDHHKGFEPAYFENIRIKNLWLSPAYGELDKDIPEKKLDSITSLKGPLRDLQAIAESGLTRLVKASPAGEIKEYLEDLLQSLTKSDALHVLNGRDKEGKKLDVEKRRYVSSDLEYEKNTQKDLATVDRWDPFTTDDRDSLFHDAKTTIKILGPRGRLKTYLSASKPDPTAPPPDPQAPPPDPEEEQSLQGVNQPNNNELVMNTVSENTTNRAEEILLPRNISAQDFDRLRAGIQGNVLAAAAELGHAINNLSVVLLLEWKGYRLLFPGDAEWDGSNIKLKDANNGSWNVMWNDDKDGELKKRIDFLKVGHHGSENATPWARTEKEEDHPINVILNGLLPEPMENEKPTALAVVSTQEVTKWPTIPDPKLLRAIGKRVANVRAFGQDLRFENDDREKYKIYNQQNEPPEPILLPARTDQKNWEKPKNANGAPKELPPADWIDVFFPAP